METAWKRKCAPGSRLLSERLLPLKWDAFRPQMQLHHESVVYFNPAIFLDWVEIETNPLNFVSLDKFCYQVRFKVVHFINKKRIIQLLFTFCFESVLWLLGWKEWGTCVSKCKCYQTRMKRMKKSKGVCNIWRDVVFYVWVVDIILLFNSMSERVYNGWNRSSRISSFNR